MPHSSLTAEFSLNTPLFSSGANPGEPELRVSEIKAALRFWWRAMNYGLYASNRSRFIYLESQLFGDASASGGQGVLVSLAGTHGSAIKRQIADIHKAFVPLPGARYLGFGLMEFARAYENAEKGTRDKFPGQLLRSCLDPDWSFEIRLVWRDESVRQKAQNRQPRPAQVLSDQEFRLNLLQAIEAFGLFGGLGSRSRRGFGSVTLQGVSAEGKPAWSAASSVPALQIAIRGLITPAKNAPAAAAKTPEGIDFSAFTPHSRSTVVAMKKSEHATAYNVLNAMGSAFVRYRAWGNRGSILAGEPATKIFEDDHNWFRGGPLRPGFAHPDRIVFGLPHPYDKRVIWGGDETRRASPLFFHVHRASADQYLGVIFDLRSRFLPAGTTLPDPKSRQRQVSITPDWTLLDDMLDGEVTIEVNNVPTPVPLFRDAVCTRVF